MDSRDFRVLFLYEWKIKHLAAAAARNTNTVFWIGSVNERTIRRWYAKFEIGDEILTNEHRGWPETGVDNEVLRAIV